MAAPALWAVSTAVAEALSFVATFDIIPPSAVPRTTRAILGLLLVPLLLANQFSTSPHSTAAPAMVGAIARGALVGLSASLVAAAARLAGTMIDNVLAAGLFAQGVFGGAGPFGLLYSIGFVYVFVRSGASTQLVGLLAAAPISTPPAHLTAIAVALIRTCTVAGLQLAGPALLFQAIAALLAGTAARIAPSLNGMLLSAPLTVVLVLAMFASGSTMLWQTLVHLSAAVIAAGALLAR